MFRRTNNICILQVYLSTNNVGPVCHQFKIFICKTLFYGFFRVCFENSILNFVTCKNVHLNSKFFVLYLLFTNPRVQIVTSSQFPLVCLKQRQLDSREWWRSRAELTPGSHLWRLSLSPDRRHGPSLINTGTFND